MQRIAIDRGDEDIFRVIWLENIILGKLVLAKAKTISAIGALKLYG